MNYFPTVGLKVETYIVGCLGVVQLPSTGLVPVGPTKVKACKSFLFTEGTPEVEIKTHV